MMDSYILIRDTLKKWGISFYSGVTGGGLVHYLKNIDPYPNNASDGTEFLNLVEFIAGFVPLGYYLADKKIAAAIATTGAATKLISCGLSDAKLHDIPAVYIVPVSGTSAFGLSPVQDSSVHGNNMVTQLQAELPDSVFLLNDPFSLSEKLAQAKNQLDNSKPVVLVLDNEQLKSKDIDITEFTVKEKSNRNNNIDLKVFIDTFRKMTDGKRLVILVGEEMARYDAAAMLTSELAEQLKSAVIWSMNGANAIDRNNPYGYGYVSFGGNDKALSLFNSLDENDVLLILGACPDEYTVNLNKFSASSTFYLGNILDAYGFINSSLEHFAKGKFYHFHAPLDISLRSLIKASKQEPFLNLEAQIAPQNLNDESYFNDAREGYVNMADLYLKLDKWWPTDSIGIDDVCLAYKDRQYVVQRPNNNIKFYSLYRGSTMGGAFGAAIGAKLSSPEKSVFLFTGDGCFRLFSGTMGEVSDLGLIVFLLNNESLGIVEQGYAVIIPHVQKTHYHAKLKSIDYCGVARAHGWDAEYLNPSLENLDNLLDNINSRKKLSKSLLIEVPVDKLQLLGRNPRLRNL